MSTPLICVKCGKEIEPGSKVVMIGEEPFEGIRARTDDDLLVRHVVCPEDVDDR